MGNIKISKDIFCLQIDWKISAGETSHVFINGTKYGNRRFYGYTTLQNSTRICSPQPNSCYSVLNQTHYSNILNDYGVSPETITHETVSRIMGNISDTQCVDPPKDYGCSHQALSMLFPKTNANIVERNDTTMILAMVSPSIVLAILFISFLFTTCKHKSEKISHKPTMWILVLISMVPCIIGTLQVWHSFDLLSSSVCSYNTYDNECSSCSMYVSSLPTELTAYISLIEKIKAWLPSFLSLFLLSNLLTPLNALIRNNIWYFSTPYFILLSTSLMVLSYYLQKVCLDINTQMSSLHTYESALQILAPNDTCSPSCINALHDFKNEFCSIPMYNLGMWFNISGLITLLFINRKTSRRRQIFRYVSSGKEIEIPSAVLDPMYKNTREQSITQVHTTESWWGRMYNIT